MNDELYFQPILSKKQWETGNLYSFQVYKSFDKARKDYPNEIIAAYKGDDIEDPTYVDK